LTLKRFLVREGLSLAFVVAIVSFLRVTVFGLYYLPSDTMRPTLLPGDTLLVNRLAYGLHLPFQERPFTSWASPARGDVIVFRNPSGEGVLVKRVVGIGGDRIAVEAGRIRLNGTPLEEVELTDESLYARYEVSAQVARLSWESPQGSSPHLVQHSLLPHRSLPDAREFVVPPDRFFCMGDHRDDSPESRFWGFIERDHVFGRAERVAYSLSPARTPAQAPAGVGADSWIRWWRTLLSVREPAV
jgi:signal peptidase I